MIQTFLIIQIITKDCDIMKILLFKKILMEEEYVILYCPSFILYKKLMFILRSLDKYWAHDGAKLLNKDLKPTFNLTRLPVYIFMNNWGEYIQMVDNIKGYQYSEVKSNKIYDVEYYLSK